MTHVCAQGKMTPKFFAVLLRDVAHLLRPSSILVLPSVPSSLEQPEHLAEHLLDTHPSSTALLGLSDLWTLFRTGHNRRGSGSSAAQNHINLKLIFYAACLLSMPSPVLRTISDEFLLRAKMEDESQELVPTQVP
jgi:hypothetical protein